MRRHNCCKQSMSGNRSERWVKRFTPPTACIKNGYLNDILHKSLEILLITTIQIECELNWYLKSIAALFWMNERKWKFLLYGFFIRNWYLFPINFSPINFLKFLRNVKIIVKKTWQISASHQENNTDNQSTPKPFWNWQQFLNKFEKSIVYKKKRKKLKFSSRKKEKRHSK